nr:ATP-dependent DNA helicase [Neobacillus sp. Marseille-Q6967]
MTKRELNPMQKEAVRTTDGPVLIIAGPGSGKTHTLVERITYLILEKKVKPEEILTATFTEKAAKELQTRVSNRLNEENVVFNLNEMYIGTLHSICLRILEENRDYTRLKKNYKMMDQFDQQYFIYQNLRSFLEIENIQLVVKKTRRWDKSAELVKWINKITEELISPAELIHSREPQMVVLGKCYLLYQSLLTEDNALDFSTIQLEAYTLLQNHPSIKEALHKKIRYIMIDEYQDTNTIQEKIVLALTNQDKNLCVVGDDDQGLYRFRGATIRNILEFPSNFKKCHQIKLNTNYRSHPDIINFYNNWMRSLNWQENGLSFRYDKDIQPWDKTFQDIPSVVKVYGNIARRNWKEEVYEFLMHLKQNGSITDWNQVAFLFWSVKNQNVVALSNYLEENGIPVYSPRSNMFFKREEIKWLLGAFMYLFPQSSQVRQWQPGASLREWEYHDTCLREFEEILNRTENAELKNWADKKAKIHGNLMENLNYGFSGLFYQLLQFPLFSNYLDGYSGKTMDSRPSRNLSIFSKLLAKFEYLERIDVLTPRYLDSKLRSFWNQYLRFLEEGGITEYEDDSEYAPSGCVSFLTIHQSKGLEFPIVLVGSLNKDPKKDYSEIDEILEGFNTKERFEPLDKIHFYDFWRLYYTAFSRAQNLLVLTGQEKTGSWRLPSNTFRDVYHRLPDWRETAIEEIDYESVKDVNLKETYSFTSHINLYNTCPLQYKFFKDLSFTPVRQGAQIFGTVVHQTIEDVHKAVLNGNEGMVTPENIAEWFENNYKYLSSRERVYLGRPQQEAALQQVKRYIERHSHDWKKVKEAEVEISLVKDNYIIKGTVDLIRGEDNTVEIIDFKSEKKPNFNIDNERLKHYQKQLEVYAHLVEEKERLNVSRMHLYYTGETESSPYITFEKSASSVRETINAFDSTVQNIETRKYLVKKRPKQHCPNCDMRFYCNKKEIDGKALC